MEEKPTSPPLSEPSILQTPALPSCLSDLVKYRLAIGINLPSATTDIESCNVVFHPTSLYSKILTQIHVRHMEYLLLEMLYYTFFTFQVLIGAVLASLGSSDKLHPVAITVLGITNACSAGFLALLKGQNVLEKLKIELGKMRALREWVEEWNVRFALGGERDEGVEDVVKEIWWRFREARGEGGVWKGGKDGVVKVRIVELHPCSPLPVQVQK
jgi:hypothetical protein